MESPTTHLNFVQVVDGRSRGPLLYLALRVLYVVLCAALPLVLFAAAVAARPPKGEWIAKGQRIAEGQRIQLAIGVGLAAVGLVVGGGGGAEEEAVIADGAEVGVLAEQLPAHPAARPLLYAHSRMPSVAAAAAQRRLCKYTTVLYVHNGLCLSYRG